MLDYRIDTFLSLCETNNYTRTAKDLNMTQPAVTQHIQYLEGYYAVKLISKKGKNFSLTKEGKALQKYAKMLKANTERIFPLLQRINEETKSLTFGATLTIGEYMVPPILYQILQNDPEIKLSMVVENTVVLLDMLWKGKIDFALLEGHFEHSEFDSMLLSNEPFIGVCSPDNPLAYQENHLHDLLYQNLILRETGSGTRDILEQILYQQNLSVDDFNHKIEIGNMNVIKELCHRDLGITFMYREAVKSELDQGYLKKIPITDFNMSHPFSFVYLKNSLNITELDYWFNKIITTRETLN